MNIRKMGSMIFGCTLLSMATSSFGAVIFSDDFETGKASSFWNGFAYVAVDALPSATERSGFGLKFTYLGNPDDTVDATSEARFDLKKEYTTIQISFDLFVPSNYSIVKPSDNAANNKFLRLWQTTYSIGEQVGVGTGPQANGEAYIGTDYRLFPDWGLSTDITEASNFIVKADLGKWIAVKIVARAPTDVSNGVLQVYKNGVLLLDDQKIPNTVPGTQGWRYGYLLGWANSGFRKDTIFYMDNVVMSDAPSNPPNSPEAAVIIVK